MTPHFHSPLATLVAAAMTAIALATDECCPHSGQTASGPMATNGSKYLLAPSVEQDLETVTSSGNKFPLPTPSSSGWHREASQGRSGKIAIQAIQGTPGGPAIANAPVEVQLYHRGMLIETINTELDEFGIVVIDDLPLAMDIQPVVLVNHADLTYQKVGAVMDRNNREQTLEVTCYELTEHPPDWKVRMRHVMLTPAPDGSDGLHVTEVMMVENLGDRTWAGEMRPGHERPVTTVFTLPDGAMGVSLGRGFHDWCCTTITEVRGSEGGIRNALLNHLPIMPGATEMIFSYIIPARRGAATIDIASPNAPGGVDQIMILVPHELNASAVTGLQNAGDDKMGQMPVQRYVAQGVQPGKTISLTLTGLASTGDSAFAAASFAKTAAAIGVIIVILGALWMIFAKPVRKKSVEPGAEQNEQPPSSYIGESI